MKQREMATRTLVGVYLVLVIVYLLVFTTGCHPIGVTATTQVGAIGPIGDSGPQGPQGPIASPGIGGTAGIVCNAYSINPSDESGTINWNQMLADGTFKFTAFVNEFNTSNEVDTNAFLNFTPTEQALIGTTNFALDCNGDLLVPETGSYTFDLGSDDGSALLLDNNTVIGMPQDQSFTTHTATITLTQGFHTFNLLYFQGPATNMGLTLQWQGPANQGLGTLSTIGHQYLSH